MTANKDTPKRRPATLPVAVWIAIFPAAIVPILSHGQSRPAAAPAPLPAGFPSELVADSQIDHWHVTNFTGPFTQVDRGTIDTPEIPGGKAQRIRSPQPRRNIYDVSVYSLNARTVHKGDRLEAAVWMRVSPVPDNLQRADVRLLIQEMDKPYPVVANRYVTVRKAWQRYTLHGTAARDYAPGQVVITVHMATDSQTIDVGHGQLFDYDR